MKLNLSLKETRDKAVSALHRRGFLHRIPGEFRVNFGQISGKFHSGYPKWHLRDSGLSLCETFSLPPRAIIKIKIIGILLTQKPFICFSFAYENEFLTRRRNKKIAQSSVARFGLFVIRLGFEPKTHSLEGCCSIQLSYRTNPYERNAPTVQNGLQR